MAGRDLPAAVAGEVIKRRLRLFHLAEFYFDSGTDRYTTAHRDINWDGHTYTASHRWLHLGEIEESAQIRSNMVDIALSGVDQTALAQALLENYIDRRVIVRRGFFDDADQVIVNPVIIFDGRIDGWGLAENPDDGSSVITWQVASHWVDFERTAGRRTNDQDQQLYYPGDRGMEFSTESAEMRWGRAD